MIKQQMASSGKSQLMEAFNDPTYAWELLQWEIAIEMNESLSGQAIARLLELYMRGVEKMNSLMDIRESYFKNKVTSLMMKGNVVKTLNKPPMAKKEKPLEIAAKKEPNNSKTKKLESSKIKIQEQAPVLKATVQPTNTLALQEKRRELEMRLAYEADSSSRQNLANMYNQQVKKEENYNSRVKNLLNDHEEKLKERIRTRKLRTATYRSRPEDTSDTFPIEENNNIKHQYQEQFSPRTTQLERQGGRKAKKHHSLDVRVAHELKIQSPPKRQRKNTHDLTQTKKQDDQQKELVSSFDQFKKIVEQAKKREEGKEIEMVIAVQSIENLRSPEEEELSKLSGGRQSV